METKSSHKANIIKLSDGLFLDIFREVSKKKDLDYDDLIVDEAAMNLVLNLEKYDVMGRYIIRFMCRIS